MHAAGELLRWQSDACGGGVSEVAVRSDDCRVMYTEGEHWGRQCSATNDGRMLEVRAKHENEGKAQARIEWGDVRRVIEA